MAYRALQFAGRHATIFLACGVFAGFALPALAHAVRPLMLPALTLALTLALLRVDWRALAGYGRNPGLVAAALVWLLLASPLITRALCAALRVPPGLSEGLTLMAASSPIFSGAALALILGLDAALAVVVTVFATALVPFTLPVLTLLLLGLQLDIGVGIFMTRLAAIVGGAFVLAWLARRFCDPAAIARHTLALDGASVWLLVVFAVSIMDGVTAYALDRPGYAIAATLAAFAANIALQVLGSAAFARLGLKRALTLGLMSGNCNMGIVLLALADKASLEVAVFFAVAQVPMYTLPALSVPVYRRLIGRARRAAAASGPS